MNINDVPQDDEGFLKAGKVRDVCYATDENGNYTQVLSLGWQPKNEAMKQAWELIHHRAEKTLEDVRKGKISPIAYYIDKNDMTIAILSQYTGIAGWRIKRHLKPSVFNKLKPSVLQKYADIFNITIQQLQLIPSS